ncbi:sigma-70 family RNA polymerase sigma factor [Gemmatimonadota bacterium]
MSDDQLEFEQIYELYQPKIRRYLNRLVGEAEAEDLAQEVFVKVSRALPNFRGESQVSTWVFRIATNAARDKLRSSSYRRNLTESLPIDSVAEAELEAIDSSTAAAESGSSAAGSLIKKEMNECIRDYIEKLTPDYKSVVLLSELEGMKNREIADVLGISLATVKIRLHRARQQLKKELDSNCIFYRDERDVLACDQKSACEDYRRKKMDKKTTELIAIGASVTANCQPCLQYHIAEAFKSGALEEEIAEAISVAKMVRKGAIAKMDKYASELSKTEELNINCNGDVPGCK